VYLPGKLPQEAEWHYKPLQKIKSPGERLRYLKIQNKVRPEDFNCGLGRITHKVGLTAYRDPKTREIQYKKESYQDNVNRGEMEKVAKEAAEKNSKLPLTGTARYTLEEPTYPRRYYGAFVYPNAEEELQRVMTTAQAKKARKANKSLFNSPIPKKEVSRYTNFKNPNITSNTKRIAKAIMKGRK